ncbi:MAG: hypothetical protein AAB553_00200 [Patescibacteria group bacterium]
MNAATLPTTLTMSTRLVERVENVVSSLKIGVYLALWILAIPLMTTIALIGWKEWNRRSELMKGDL